MFRNHQSFLCATLGLMLGLCAAQPLRAQLDPRLQNSKTDLLDLYQQSSSLKPKPEIATIVDCSGSMATLMYHPLYQSMDIQDADDYRYMSFTYHAASGGTAAANVYTITATAANPPCAVTATYTVTVTSSGATGVANTPAIGCNTNPASSLAPTITIEAYANGDTSAQETLVFTPTAVGANPSYTLTSNGNTGLKSNITGNYEMTNASGTLSPTPTLQVTTASHVSPYPTGTAFTFTSWLTHSFSEGEASSDKLITWTQSNGGSTPAQSSWTEVTPDLLYKSVATWTIPTWNPTYAPTQLKPITAMVGAVTTNSFASGNTVALNDYFLSLPTGYSTVNLTWTVSANTSNTCTGAPGAITGGDQSAAKTSATTSAGHPVSWTVPAFCSNANTGSTAAYVSVSLDPRVGANYTAPGVTYLTSVLTANTNTNATGGVGDSNSALRKPDGTAVNASDAAAAATNDPSPVAPSLAYTHLGSADVRNWIRAASHVRFAATANGKARTIDIPIPWKITDATQTITSPLNSSTVLDQEVVTSIVAGNSVNTTYGSGLNIELDQTYKVENANGAILTADQNGTALTASACTTCYLYGVVYRPAYISWLFTGTYQHTNTTWPAYTADTTLYSTSGANFVVFDTAVGTLVPNQGATHLSWGQGFGPAGNSWGNIMVPQYNTSGTYTTDALEDASLLATPSLTRLQAVKKAAISTWIANQASVYWALRELDVNNESNLGLATTIDNNSTTTLSAATGATSHLNGQDSGWTVFNNLPGSNPITQGPNATGGNSVNGMNRLSYLFANSETPLTYAVARALAQFQDPNSVFNAVEGTNVSSCANSFLMLFTDGIDNNAQEGYNNPNLTTPYITGSGVTASLNPLAGNDYIIANPGSINRSGSYWNLFTFAGMGAHLADASMGVLGTDYLNQPSPGTTWTSGAPQNFMPFAISQRGNTANSNLTIFKTNHRVTIMTVGVSLGGTINTSGGPKANLFQAAVVGDPLSNTTELMSAFHTFVPPGQPNTAWPAGGWAGVYLTPPTYPTGWVTNDWIVDPKDPGDYPTIGMRAPGAVYFFDGSNPNQIIADMSWAFKLAAAVGGNNSTSNPDLPFVGASLGQEVYMGTFQPPTIGGAIWPGDLQMFATRTNAAGAVNFLDQNGNQTTVLNSTTAQWSAASALAARLWSNRNLYTRLPATTTAEPAITSFSTANAALLPYVATSQSNQNLVQAVIQFASGGNTASVTAPTPPTTNRSNIMGDIISSAPAAVAYDFSQVESGLTSRLSAVNGNTFRLILVGDNQGWLHGFGEVSKTTTDPNGDGNTLTTGNVDELWAFMPTDFLANLDYITNNNNTHRYMVNGSPTVYFLNVPATAGAVPSGVVESNERAVAIFGLGKGGRSYYALDIHNPYSPALLWSLRPDEAALFPPSRIVSGGPSLATVQGILSRFGFSTAAPALGRVTFNGYIHDCVFLSGGLSEPEVEANFPDPNNSNNPTPLGRSVIALDVYTGQVLAAVELNTNASEGGFWQSSVGSIYAGVVPFEFILNSGYAQRAYFTDYNGGLWSWGSKAVLPSGNYKNFRNDSSEITSWSIRKVFQDDNTAASGLGARYSTLPAPFLDTSFPGPAAATGLPTPTAVGIALESGDWNNPLDENYYTTPTPANLAPTHHALYVVFDRQDSRILNLDTVSGPDTGIKPGIGTTNLLVSLDTQPLLSTPSSPCSDAWFSVFTAGCSGNFLGTTASPKYGYYVTFPSISAAGFIPKAMNPPILVANELLYSYFTPTASNPCTGGSGNTTSWLIANVMDPVVNDQRSGQFVPSGLRTTWTGVASNYIAVGTTSVLQGGTLTSTNTAGVTSTNPAIVNTPTQPGSRFPKVRVWREVQ